MGIRDLFSRLTLWQAKPENLAEAERLLDGFMKAHEHKTQDWHTLADRKFSLTDEINATSREMQMLVLLATAEELHRTKDLTPTSLALTSLFGQLARRKLPYNAEVLASLLQYAGKTQSYLLPPTSIVTRAEEYLTDHELTPELTREFKRLSNRLASHNTGADERRLKSRIDRVVRDAEEGPVLDVRDEWARRAALTLLKEKPAIRAAWEDLLRHAAKATQAKPTKNWKSGADKCVAEIGFGAFHEFVAMCTEAVGLPGTQPRPFEDWGFDQTLLGERNSDILRGLVWCFAGAEGAPYARTIGDLAERCYKKIPNVGSLSTKVGNACVYALGQMPAPHGVAELSRLRSRAKLPSIRKMIEKALNSAAAYAGVGIDELEEMSTPTYGLGPDGEFRKTLGDYAAVLAVAAGRTIELTWINKSGKRVKSVPKPVKEDYAQALKSLRKTAKDIQKTLAAVRYRLERAPINDRSWTVDQWRKRFIDHALGATIARRLIWNFDADQGRASAICDGDNLVTHEDKQFAPPNDARVTLWHPVDADADEVRAWRTWLENREITQPFKQAHREVYLLTPAEEQTDTYSNRFAAHILKQHQLNALAQQRGWKTGLFGMFDSCNTPTLEMPHWNLSAEFWLEPIEGGPDNLSDMYILLNVASDQVRFVDQNNHAVALRQVRPIVFSEVMRDVDLFVGVASIGNDPAWIDQGNRDHLDYWHSVSFGDLTQVASTRHDTLARLLPRLNIADRCELTDRFLVVRGDLRTYKIHLGSANILMEPNDQYLCIVPGREVRDPYKVYLPFEGDRTLAVILSKAFMLAADTKIKDHSIMVQIKGRF